MCRGGTGYGEKGRDRQERAIDSGPLSPDSWVVLREEEEGVGEEEDPRLEDDEEVENEDEFGRRVQGPPKLPYEESVVEKEEELPDSGFSSPSQSPGRRGEMYTLRFSTLGGSVRESGPLPSMRTSDTGKTEIYVEVEVLEPSRRVKRLRVQVPHSYYP